MSTMSRSTGVVLGLAVGLVLFLAANVLANTSLRSLRFDMTEEKLFTLSEGSKRIATNTEETIRLRLYFSEEAASVSPVYKNYARRVRELLEEYAHASGGTIEVEVLDPEPYSETEEAAVQEGLPAAPLSGGGKLYFGLVATNATGDKEVLPFFTPERERFLEYDVSRILHRLNNPDLETVGVLSSLPLDGGFNPMMGMQARQRWKILDHIESLFSTRILRDGVDEIPEEVDVLMIVHPKGFAPKTLYAIDQYVLDGGKAVVFVDPFCEADQSGNDPSNPLAGMGADKSSDLGPLLESWGLELVPARIAADRKNALQVMYQQRPTTFVAWLGLDGEFFDGEDAITSQLQEVRIPTPGILRRTPEATTELQKLMWTSTDAMDLDVGSVQFRTPPKELLTGFVPRHESYTIAARISGNVSTAYPEGPPGDDEIPAAGTDGEGEEGEPALPEGHLAASTTPINVVVMADCDLLVDQFWIEEATLMGIRLGLTKTADNGDFVVNAIENLIGGDDLISIRARGRFTRPFERVIAIQREAEQEYLAEERDLEEKLRAAERRINELRQQAGPDSSVILSPEVEQEIAQARQEMVEANKALRQVQHNLRKDIERLGLVLKLINIGLLPLLITIGAVMLGVVRIQRRKIG